MAVKSKKRAAGASSAGALRRPAYGDTAHAVDALVKNAGRRGITEAQIVKRLGRAQRTINGALRASVAAGLCIREAGYPKTGPRKNICRYRYYWKEGAEPGTDSGET